MDINVQYSQTLWWLDFKKKYANKTKGHIQSEGKILWYKMVYDTAMW